MKRRPEIDGLRAVAVLPIVLFHLGVGAVSGGFVGVDIFYVISGFLITGIIAPQIAGGDFRLGGFYERRARRLFPALFTMLAVVSLACAVMLMPMDLAAYGRTALAAAFFVSNIFFWRNAGYFDADSALKPLLHTWSLGVEEQFYLVFPLLLVVAWKLFKARWLWVMGLGAVISLTLCVWLTDYRPSAAFFLLPPRGWELLLGALLSFVHTKRLNRYLAEAMTLAGYGLILWSVIVFTPQTDFPGIAALAPATGALVLILAAQDAPAAGWLLRWAPMRFIGRISYSLYLWHWPIAALYRYRTGLEPTGLAVLGLLIVTFVISILSWRFIEEPIRKRSLWGSRRAIVAATGVAMACAAAAELTIVLTGGLPGRFTPRVLAFERVSGDHDSVKEIQGRLQPDTSLRIGAPNAEPSIVLWGDSHAWALRPTYSDALIRLGEAGYLAALSGCPPVIGVRRLNYAERCDRFADNTLGFIRAHHIKTVILSAFWSSYFRTPLQDVSTGSRGEPNAQILTRRMRAELMTLRAMGVRVFLQDPIPGARRDVPRAMAEQAAWGDAGPPLTFTLADYVKENAQFFRMASQDADLIDGRIAPWRPICASGLCIVDRGGWPIYFDAHHPTKSNFAFVVPQLVADLQARAGRPDGATRP